MDCFQVKYITKNQDPICDLDAWEIVFVPEGICGPSGEKKEKTGARMAVPAM